MYKYEQNDNGAYQKAGLILFQDCSLCIFASILAILIVRWVSEPAPGFTFVVLKWVAASLVASLASILLCGSHRVVRRYATVKSTSRLIWAILCKEVVLIAVVAFNLVISTDIMQKVLLILADTLFTSVLLLYIRFAARIFSSGETGTMKEVVARKNALIAGTDEDSIQMALRVAASNEYNVLGFITDNKSMSGCIIGNFEVFFCANPKELEALEWRLGGVDCIFLTKGATGTSILSKFEQQEQADSEAEDLSAGDRPAGATLMGRFMKRSFDAVLSGVLLVIFSPLCLAVAIAILLEDGEPVIYKQQRVGLNGKPFQIYKFRSMRVDAEAAGAQLYSGDSDPRLTKVGAFIRRHHLDELPQLWNVFVGDMSFVGYRPERPFYINKIMEKNPRYRYLYQIRPGVTSYATLYNGYTDTLEKMLTRLDLDLYYLRHHSVLFDFKVLGLTFLNIVGGKKF